MVNNPLSCYQKYVTKCASIYELSGVAGVLCIGEEEGRVFELRSLVEMS